MLHFSAVFTVHLHKGVDVRPHFVEYSLDPEKLMKITISFPLYSLLIKLNFKNRILLFLIVNIIKHFKS